MFPLRGLWNRRPPEGEFFVNCEIDWLVSPPGQAVQFALSGNSPVALSQIAGLYVDNRRSGSDVEFLFPDSGFLLTIAARAQGLYPVLTNALMFYAMAPASVIGDMTILQILNSMPPPIPISPPSQAQNVVSVQGIALANGTSPIVQPTQNGTVQTISLMVDGAAPATNGSATIALADSRGNLWATIVAVPSNGVQSIPITLPNLNIRFVGYLNLIVTASNFTAGSIVANVYYSSP